MQNESETEFHRVYKVCFNSTTLISLHLLMESGDGVLLVQWLDQLKQMKKISSPKRHFRIHFTCQTMKQYFGEMFFFHVSCQSLMC